MQSLLLIDGNAIVHRAYHALPFLNADKDVPTNAVYGFFAMVLKVINDLNPTNVIVCFDMAAPTFRKQMYVGYQSTRPKMVDELSNQFKILNSILEKANFTLFGVEGYEADDLIGTLARQSSQASVDTTILTGDRDLLQLVNKHTKVMAPVVGVSNTITYDEARVREKYGMWPRQFVDYKALIGDASDNYPGVTGIGPKTAVTLVEKYGTLEEIYSKLGDIQPRIGEKLARDAEQAMLAKKLATILTDAPVKFDVKKSRTDKIDRDQLLESFLELGFHSLIKRFFMKEDGEIQKPENSPLPKVSDGKEKIDSSDDQLNLL